VSGQLAFLDVNGHEVANSYRTASYMQRGLAAINWTVPDLGCLVLAREVGGVSPFVSPSADPAPWYDAAIAESAEFLGLYLTELDFQSTVTLRSIKQRFGGVGGGTISFEQSAARGCVAAGYLIASSCAGLEYGRHWLAAQLGESVSGACELVSLRVRDSCPPDNGLNDERGEWILYDAALVDGVKRTDNSPACCDYDGIGFALAGQSPYLFKRTGVASAPVEIGQAGGLMVPVPAILDTFVRANQGPPPTGWTGSTFQGEGNTLRVLANVLDNSVHTNGTQGSAHWSAAQYGPSVAATVVVPTRVNNGAFEIRARVINPATANAAGCYARIMFGAGAGLDSWQLGRRSVTWAPQTTWTYNSGSGQTFASGDTFALLCRGTMLSLWRKPSGGQWTRIAHAYDPTTPAAGYVGLAFYETTATQTLGAFGAGTLTNGDVYPTDIVNVTIPASKTRIGSPLITLVADSTVLDKVSVGNVRIQLKQYDECDETDAFGSNSIPASWYQTSALYAISGGKLKPAGTGARLIRRSRDGTLAGIVQYPGGKVEAAVTLGSTLTNGTWGVTLDGTQGFTARISTPAATFAILNYLGQVLDSVPFTPVASATYRIILEALPVTATTWDVRAYLVDQALPTIMATRPLRAATAIGLGPYFAPGITSIAADVTEAWDSFYAVDYSDPTGWMSFAIPPGTMVIDVARRTAVFTPKGSLVSIDGTQYISTPSGTPLYWPDVEPNSGPGCVQVYATSTQNPGALLSVALQSRTR
jgi:hypothetical protein